MLLIPIGHDRSIRAFPWLTAAIMLMCALVQVHRTRLEWRALSAEQALDADQVEQLVAGDPVERFGYRASRPLSINVIAAAFVHGGWLHLIGNLLFLWLVGCNLEDRWGRLRYGVFYLLGAVAAAWSYTLVHRGDDTPMVGASGAIAAAMGAFLIYCHGASIRFWYLLTFPPFPRGTFEVRALYVLPLWFGQQLLASRLEGGFEGDGVAYSAHVGGFVFGVVAALLMRRWEERPTRAPRVELPSSGREEREQALGACLDAVRAGVRAPLEQQLDGTLQWLRSQRRGPDALALYEDVEARWPGFPLSDEALAALVTAARLTGDRELATALSLRLLQEHPRGGRVSEILWLLAGDAQREGRADQARALWQRLATEHENDSYGRMARDKLREGS